MYQGKMIGNDKNFARCRIHGQGCHVCDEMRVPGQRSKDTVLVEHQIEDGLEELQLEIMDLEDEMDGYYYSDAHWV